MARVRNAKRKSIGQGPFLPLRVTIAETIKKEDVNRSASDCLFSAHELVSDITKNMKLETCLGEMTISQIKHALKTGRFK